MVLAKDHLAKNRNSLLKFLYVCVRGVRGYLFAIELPVFLVETEVRLKVNEKRVCYHHYIMHCGFNSIYMNI